MSKTCSLRVHYVLHTVFLSLSTHVTIFSNGMIYSDKIYHWDYIMYFLHSIWWQLCMYVYSLRVHYVLHTEFYQPIMMFSFYQICSLRIHYVLHTEFYPTVHCEYIQWEYIMYFIQSLINSCHYFHFNNNNLSTSKNF